MSDQPSSGAGARDSRPLIIAPGEVHVWRAVLDGWPPSRITELAQTLSTDEQARAARLVRPDDRSRFTVARAILRDILSRYVGVLPGELVFSQAKQGKPHLIQPSVPLQFNVSHSAERLLIAISDGPAVGVDIERLRALPDLMELAARFFSVREHSALLSLEGWERIGAFFNAWTRKEAVMKARGDGLTCRWIRWK
jgi:4'-phosphopantetheinyl transferase